MSLESTLLEMTQHIATLERRVSELAEKEVPYRWVNVVDCGAVGDGSHDDTAAFQEAFDRAGLGGTVYAPIPPSYWSLTATITGDANLVGDMWAGNSASLIPSLVGTVIKSSVAGPAFQITQFACGVTHHDYCLLMTNAGATIGIEFPYGGNFNHFENLVISGPDNAGGVPPWDMDYGIYIRGVNIIANPDVANGHQHYNSFKRLLLNQMQVGIRVGDVIAGPTAGDATGNANYFEHIFEGCGSYAIEINGYGSTFVHLTLSNAGIRFFGLAGDNTLLGGYIDGALATAVTIDADVGERYIFSAHGTLGLDTSVVVDNIIANPQDIVARYSIFGGNRSVFSTIDVDGSVGDPTLGINWYYRRLIHRGTSSDGGDTPFVFEGSQSHSIVKKNAAYTATKDDYRILCTAAAGAWNLGIPDPAAAGTGTYRFEIKNYGAANNVTVVPVAPALIEGAANFALAPGDSIVVEDDGTDYFIMAKYP